VAKEVFLNCAVNELTILAANIFESPFPQKPEYVHSPIYVSDVRIYGNDHS
jgi:hypothetical protein